MYILKETQTTASIIVETHTPRIAGPWSSLFCDKFLDSTSVAMIKNLAATSLRRRAFLETRNVIC